MDKNEIAKKSLQDSLTETLIDTFEGVIESKKKYYETNEKPKVEDIKKLISEASNKNALISGGAGLIPGPWGMLAAIPEIVMIVRTQINMIYDIGIAYGKEKIMTKELLVGIALMAMGSSGIGLLTMHGGKYFVKRTSLRFFQQIVKVLAGKTTQQLLKSSIAKWLPVIGAAAMATWAKYSTNEIGKKAVEILSKDIEIENTELIESSIQNTDVVEVEVEATHAKNENIYDEQKIYALINLMRIDRKIEEEELLFINTIIDNSSFSAEKKENFKSLLNSETKIAIDYSIFQNNPQESVGLMVDLIALAKRDNDFDFSEKLLIKEIGKKVGFGDSDISELMS